MILNTFINNNGITCTIEILQVYKAFRNLRPHNQLGEVGDRRARYNCRALVANIKNLSSAAIYSEG